MARSASKFRSMVEYLPVRGLAFALSLLPLGAGRWVGRRLGDLFRLADRRHRERATTQATERLGLSPDAARRLIKANFHSYGMLLAEFCRFSRLDLAEAVGQIDMDGMRALSQRLAAEGKGIIYITAHFGDWEWGNAALRACGFTGGVIARPLDNPYLDGFVRRVREKNGLEVLDKGNGFRKALRILEKNGVVAFLTDQDSGHQGLMSPFFGLAASTTTVPIEMAMRTGAPLIVAVLRREMDGGKPFSMRFIAEPRRFDPNADPDAEVRRLVDTLNADLAHLIREAPEQWFWMHRRWKTRETREKSFARAAAKP